MNLLLLLLLKHVICDLAIQPISYPNDNKRKYFGLHAHLKHYIPHGIGTFIVLIFFFDWQTSLLFGFIDYIAHWHIDYIKTNAMRKGNYTRNDRTFWVYNAIDQFAHYLTYWVITMELLFI